MYYPLKDLFENWNFEGNESPKIAGAPSIISGNNSKKEMCFK
jgi:hypothetical protein